MPPCLSLECHPAGSLISSELFPKKKRQSSQDWCVGCAFIALGPPVNCAGSKLLHVVCLLFWCWGNCYEGFFGFLVGSCFSFSTPPGGEQEGACQPP